METWRCVYPQVRFANAEMGTGTTTEPGHRPAELGTQAKARRTGLPTQNWVRRRNGYAEANARPLLFATQNRVRFRTVCRRNGYAAGAG
ncbi:hypothetical protein D3C81_1200230 [compost metagenome]